MPRLSSLSHCINHLKSCESVYNIIMDVLRPYVFFLLVFGIIFLDHQNLLLATKAVHDSRTRHDISARSHVAVGDAIFGANVSLWNAFETSDLNISETVRPRAKISEQSMRTRPLDQMRFCHWSIFGSFVTTGSSFLLWTRFFKLMHRRNKLKTVSCTVSCL